MNYLINDMYLLKHFDRNIDDNTKIEMDKATDLAVGASTYGSGPVEQTEFFAASIVDLARIVSLLALRTEHFDIFQWFAQLGQNASYLWHVANRCLNTNYS